MDKNEQLPDKLHIHDSCNIECGITPHNSIVNRGWELFLAEMAGVRRPSRAAFWLKPPYVCGIALSRTSKAQKQPARFAGRA
eukprot:scaffold79945_cov23-Tisochrysis_lutea.AAC.1